MTGARFDSANSELIAKCLSLLETKAEEYATSDRLHNFKVAAELQGCTAIKALGGMMAKHTVSIYDLINRENEGNFVEENLWQEKICDSINYLLLLNALVYEELQRNREVVTSYQIKEEIQWV